MTKEKDPTETPSFEDLEIEELEEVIAPGVLLSE
jgi:hypothetical protein